jgi:hypothetical protein
MLTCTNIVMVRSLLVVKPRHSVEQLNFIYYCADGRLTGCDPMCTHKWIPAFRDHTALIFSLEYRGSMFFRDARTYVQGYTASPPVRPPSTCSPPSDLRIILQVLKYIRIRFRYLEIRAVSGCYKPHILTPPKRL